MYIELLLIISLLPVILIGSFIYKKDKNKEPARLLAKLFIAGVASTIIVLILSGLSELIIPSFGKELEYQNSIERFLYAFVGIALIEESSKWIMVYFISFNHKEFDELYDMVIYAVFVALGFACIENLIYVLQGGISTGILRAISAVPGHACDGIFMGYYLAFAKLSEYNNNLKGKKKYMILSLLVPAILHGIYDYCILSGYALLVIGFYVFVAFLYKYSLRRLNHIVITNRKFVYNNKYCTGCGEKIESEFCTKCGKRNE